jgi:hypothetical protein
MLQLPADFFEADGQWRKFHDLTVDPSDPSQVERQAKKYAQNHQMAFYDKNLRKVTPAQCFQAAVEDGTNTIFMARQGELAVNEQMVDSVSQFLDKRNTKRRA